MPEQVTLTINPAQAKYLLEVITGDSEYDDEEALSEIDFNDLLEILQKATTA